MRDRDFVSEGFLALIATCIVLLCSSWLVIALLAWLWRNSSPPKLFVTLKSRVRSIPANWTVRRLSSWGLRRRGNDCRPNLKIPRMISDSERYCRGGN